MDLLAALAPRVSTAPDSAQPDDDAVGVFPFIAMAAKGAAKGGGKPKQSLIQQGLMFVRSPEGKKLIASLRDNEVKATRRMKLYQAKADQATKASVKKRWQRRADRQQRRLDDARVTRELTQKGIVSKPAQLEYKRNLLAMEWEGATPSRKKSIERKIRRMDTRLKRHAMERTLLERTMSPRQAKKAVRKAARAERKAERKAERQEKKVERQAKKASTGADDEDVAFVPYGRVKRRLARLPRAAVPNAMRALVNADKRILSGMGGMRFDVQSPPGPGRLVRIPFYAENSAFTWSGANGIDFVDDDPVTMLVIDSVPAFSRIAKPLLLRTERFDYGSFRILGFQVNEQGNYPSTNILGGGNPTNQSIVISFSNLQLYNGQTLFLQQDQIWSATFDVFPSDFQWSGLTPSPLAGDMQMQLPSQYAQRRSRWFTGLRDFPIVTGTTFVSVEVTAYSILPTTAENPQYQIPVTCNVIGEMVEDRVFGDPVNPSPVARGGATVKVAAKEVGLGIEGQQQVEIVSARHRRLLTE
jgi:hypothetical protein